MKWFRFVSLAGMVACGNNALIFSHQDIGGVKQDMITAESCGNNIEDFMMLAKRAEDFCHGMQGRSQIIYGSASENGRFYTIAFVCHEQRDFRARK